MIFYRFIKFLFVKSSIVSLKLPTPGSIIISDFLISTELSVRHISNFLSVILKMVFYEPILPAFEYLIIDTFFHLKNY